MSEESTLTANVLAEHQPALHQENMQALPNEETENIVKQVIIDDDDDDDEQSSDGHQLLPYSDHNYDASDPTKKVKDSTEFPVCLSLAEFGIHDDESTSAADINHSRSDKHYEQPNIIYTNRRDQSTSGVAVHRTVGGGDVTGGTRKLVIGGTNYTYSNTSLAHGTVPFGFKAVPREFSAASGVSAQYVVGGFPSPMRRNLPMGPTPNVTVQKKLGRPKNIVRSSAQQPPSSTPSDPPPHRALLTGKPIAPAPPPPPVFQAQSVAISNQIPVENNADSIQMPKGGAPLLVAGRGAKPMIRGRAGAGMTNARKPEPKQSDGIPMPDDVLADDSQIIQHHQQGMPRSASPRKMVQFSDVLIPGSSSLSTVNVVVGAPPQVNNNVSHLAISKIEGHEIDRDAETERVVAENVQAIHARTFQQQPHHVLTPAPQQMVAHHMHQLHPSPEFTLSNVQREPRVPQNMPPEVQQLLSKGESCTRIINFKTLCNAKQATPDLPPDLLQPEVRPRGRPKGSTNRSREARSSVSASGIPSSPGSGSPAQGVTSTPQATSQLPGSSPRRGSPVKYASSPQRGISVKSPLKTPQHADEGDSLPPLVPPAVPSLGANAPSPTHTYAQNGEAPQINPAYTPRAVYNIPVTSPLVNVSSRSKRKSESINLEKADISSLPLPSITTEPELAPPFSNGIKEASSAEESAEEEESQSENDSDNESEVSDTTVDEAAEWGDYVTRCNCGLTHSDELMVQCEQCEVWQHCKCMGLNKNQIPEMYYCEKCRPRPLKWNSEQARDYQQKTIKALQKATEKRRQERRARRKRNEELKKAKVAKSKMIKKKVVPKSASGLLYRKFTEVTKNTYSKMANNLLRVYGSTEGAQKILDDVESNASKFGRMFVAPGIEGIVAVEDIAKSCLVMEFVGNVCLPSECAGREKPGMVQPYTILYNGLSEQDSLLVLDARKTGSDSRFVRRSCRPNTVLRHVMHQEGIHVLLTATELIEKSMEITIPFDSDYNQCTRPLQCACGDENTCPIADFNRKLNDEPEQKRKSSLSGRRSSISSKLRAPTREQKPKKQEREEPTSGKRGRPSGGSGRKGMIKLRRPERKSTKEEVDDENTNSDLEKSTTERRAARRKTRESLKKEESEEPVASSSEDKLESGANRRDSRRLRRETDKEEKQAVEEETKQEERKDDPKRKINKEKIKDEKVEKQDVAENNFPDEDEPVPRKRTRASTITSIKSEKSDIDEKPSKSRRATGGKDKLRESTKEEQFIPSSPRKERKRRESEKKEEMDYTLPEDRNKAMTREERKLAASVALIEKINQQHKEHDAHAHKRKSISPIKEKRQRDSSISEKTVEKERKDKEKEKEERMKEKELEKEESKKKIEKERHKKEDKANRNKITRSSPRSPKKEVEIKEEVVPIVEEHIQHIEERTTIISAPPRKRWQQEQEMKEEQELSSPSRDVAPGKKAWLLRRAQAEKDEPAPPDPAPTMPQPTVFEAPPKPLSTHLSPPLKKRRPIIETSSETDALSRNEAAELLTQMAAIAGPSTSVMPIIAPPEKTLREKLRDCARDSVLGYNTSDFELPSDGFPQTSAPRSVYKKRISIDDYRKRKVQPTASSPTTLVAPSLDTSYMKKKSFIPSMQDSEGTLLLAPVPDPSVLGSPVADISELKKRIYGQTSGSDVVLPPPPPEPRLEPPPPPPPMPKDSPKKSVPEGGVRTRSSPQKSCAIEGENADEERPRQSLADRLKMEFGI